jgi:hypothetical protein
MTCAEFQRVLPQLDESSHLERDKHLQTCPVCALLVAELDAISQEARSLAEDAEPNPRVWNSLQIALRREGLIRDSQPLTVPQEHVTRWRPVWLVPLAAAFAVAFGLLLNQRGGVEPQTARSSIAAPPTVTAKLESDVMPADENALLNAVEQRAPAMRSAYESELKAVDAYIRDAELSARNNPNDEIAQQYLTNAYEQKALVYEMALDRGQP